MSKTCVYSSSTALTSTPSNGRTTTPQLYRLSGVPPVQLIEAHDGTSRIEVPDLPVRKQFSWLWDCLVPMGGSAETVQGEVVRIAGRIESASRGYSALKDGSAVMVLHSS